MSVDMLNMQGGTGQVRTAPSRSSAAVSGQGDAGSGAAQGDFAGMMEAQSEGALKPDQAVAQPTRGKAGKKNPSAPEAGTETGAAAARAASGSSETKGRAAMVLDREQETADADGEAEGAAAAAAVAASVVPVPVASQAVATGTSGAIDGDAATPATYPAGEVRAQAALADAGKPGFDDALATANATTAMPDTGKKTGGDAGPRKGGQQDGVSVALSGDEAAAGAERTASAGQTSAPRPGEATALLDIVKSELPARKSAAPARTADAQAGAGQGKTDKAVPVADAAAKATTMPSDGTRTQAPGLVVAAEHVPNEAQQTLARVADRIATRQNGTAAASAREQAAARTSSLAIAAAQSVDATVQAAGNGARADGKASLSGLTGGRGDARAAGDGTLPATAIAVPLIDAAATGAPAGSPGVQGMIPPATSLSVSLGQQVIDLGVSGQWIDDISRQIASISANPGHGSFQIASQTLGTVRVDIAPGANGANVHMTVDNEAAQAALAKDHARLVQDAQLAAVRIGDVRIDRVAPAADAQRGDMGNGGQNGGGNAQQGAQASFAQNGGQGGQSGSRQDASAFASAGSGDNSGGHTPKSSFTRAVINDAVAAESATSSRGGRADTARYA